MGMHEFEAAADMAVITLDKAKPALPDLRSMFASIKKFTEQWDAAFQHFHILDILIKHRFTYYVPVHEYPGYDHHKVFFENLKECENILLHPQKPYDEINNPEVAIYCHPEEAWHTALEHIPSHLQHVGMIYYDAGSEIWMQRVLNGRLKASDQEPIIELPIEEVIANAVTEAQKQEDLNVISYWYPLITNVVFLQKEVAAEEWIKNKHMMQIRKIAIETAAFAINNDYGLTRLPSIEDLNTNFNTLEPPSLSVFFQWWYQPLKEWINNPGNKDILIKKGNQALEEAHVRAKNIWTILYPNNLTKETSILLEEHKQQAELVHNLLMTEQGKRFPAEDSEKLDKAIKTYYEQLPAIYQAPLNYYQQALTADPGSAKPEYNMAIVYWIIHNPLLAKIYFTRSIHKDQDNANSFVLRAVVNDWLGNDDEAEQDKRTAYSIDPENAYLKLYFPKK